MSEQSRYVYRGPLAEVTIDGKTVAQGDTVALDDATLQPLHEAGHHFDFVVPPVAEEAEPAAPKAKARAKPKE